MNLHSYNSKDGLRSRETGKVEGVYTARFWLSAWAPAPKSAALCSLLSETFALYNGTPLHSDDLRSCPGEGWEWGQG